MSTEIISTDDTTEITNERLVFKDNALIMASYSLTIEEQRLILACIEKAQRKKEPLKSYAVEITLMAEEYTKLFDVKMVTAYKALHSASNKLYDRSIIIDDGGVTRKIRWLQEQANYENGRVKLVFSETISRHIKDIATGKTAFRLKQATQLRSQHAIRFFEIFQMAIDPETQEATWEVGIDELKNILEMNDSYPVWADFKKRVIVPCMNQINKNTSLKVDWEVAEKVGKQISKLRFKVFESSQLRLSL